MRTEFGPAGQMSGQERWRVPFPVQRSTQTTAWVVLWSAFLIFCVILAGAFYGAKRYYDEATLPGVASLSIDEGIVLFRDAVTSALVNAQDDLSLRAGDELLVGSGARASFTLFDGSTVILYPGTTMRIREMNVTRFHPTASTIALQLDEGSARIIASEPSSRARSFVIGTPFGAVSISGGSTGLEVTGSGARVSLRSGAAAISAASGVVQIVAGEKAIMTGSELSGPMPEGDQLVANGGFAEGFAGWKLLNVDEMGRLVVEPSERYLVTEKVDGRDVIAMRVARESPSGTHNETGVSQVINKDVSDYESLLLTADLRVDEQSLSGGGYLGYEYPAMIRVQYRDTEGQQINWSHGFFYQNPENRPTPNGQQVPQGQWIPYDGELMNLADKPAYIMSIEVLGAGHTFDSMIGNVSLIGK